MEVWRSMYNELNIRSSLTYVQSVDKKHFIAQSNIGSWHISQGTLKFISGYKYVWWRPSSDTNTIYNRHILTIFGAPHHQHAGTWNQGRWCLLIPIMMRAHCVYCVWLWLVTGPFFHQYRSGCISHTNCPNTSVVIIINKGKKILRIDYKQTMWLQKHNAQPNRVYTCIIYGTSSIYGADSRLAPRRWQTSLQSNTVSHWLIAYLTTLQTPQQTWGHPAFRQECMIVRHNLIEGVSKWMTTRQEAQAKFNEYHETQESNDEVYAVGSKANEREGSAPVINRHLQNGETTCRHLFKRLSDNSTIFAA